MILFNEQRLWREVSGWAFVNFWVNTRNCSCPYFRDNLAEVALKALMTQHGCALQEEDSAQGPEEEPTEEPENHDQVEPVCQNHAAQHHPPARPERE